MATQLIRNEAKMARAKVFIDEHGVTWVTPARAAEIWNERAEKENKVKGLYTRWSVFQRREGLETKETPGGLLYREDVIRSIEIRPHPKGRPDRRKKENEFSEETKTDSKTS